MQYYVLTKYVCIFHMLHRWILMGVVTVGISSSCVETYIIIYNALTIVTNDTNILSSLVALWHFALGYLVCGCHFEVRIAC